MVESSKEKGFKFQKIHKKKQLALKSLNNYLEQLKIHFDLNDEDIVRILKLYIGKRNNDSFIKKLWHILG
jgi:hypothetical protein